MSDAPVVITGLTLMGGLIGGVFALPVGRWLGGGPKGKLAAFICAMLGSFTATPALILLRIKVLESTPYPTTEINGDSYLLWLGIGLVSACLYRLAYRPIVSRLVIRSSNQPR